MGAPTDDSHIADQMLSLYGFHLRARVITVATPEEVDHCGITSRPATATD